MTLCVSKIIWPLPLINDIQKTTQLAHHRDEHDLNVLLLCVHVCMCVCVSLCFPAASECIGLTHTYTQMWPLKNDDTLWCQWWLDPGSSPGQPCLSQVAHEYYFRGKRDRAKKKNKTKVVLMSTWVNMSTKVVLMSTWGQYELSVSGSVGWI